jgi:hypothetical protein
MRAPARHTWSRLTSGELAFEPALTVDFRFRPRIHTSQLISIALSPHSFAPLRTISAQAGLKPMSMQAKDLDFDWHRNIPYAYRVLLENH